jgi:nickel/cobalt exporter
VTSGLALAGAAATVAALHTLAPDHWVPFAAVARARGWSAARTARVTLACGLGHVTVSAALGLLAIALGRELMETLGHRLETLAGGLLIAFGVLYAAWGLRRGVAERVHGHSHARFDHVHDPGRATALGMFALFSVDPCVALIPILVAAAGLGWVAIAGIVLAYEVATISAMLALVLTARRGAHVASWPWLDRWADAAAGAVVLGVGLLVSALGI